MIQRKSFLVILGIFTLCVDVHGDTLQENIAIKKEKIKSNKENYHYIADENYYTWSCHQSQNESQNGETAKEIESQNAENAKEIESQKAKEISTVKSLKKDASDFESDFESDGEKQARNIEHLLNTTPMGSTLKEDMITIELTDEADAKKTYDDAKKTIPEGKQEKLVAKKLEKTHPHDYAKIKKFNKDPEKYTSEFNKDPTKYASKWASTHPISSDAAIANDYKIDNILYQNPETNLPKMGAICNSNRGEWQAGKGQCSYTALDSKTTESDLQGLRYNDTVIVTTSQANKINRACSEYKGKIEKTKVGEVDTTKGTVKSSQYLCTIPTTAPTTRLEKQKKNVEYSADTESGSTFKESLDTIKLTDEADAKKTITEHGKQEKVAAKKLEKPHPHKDAEIKEFNKDPKKYTSKFASTHPISSDAAIVVDYKLYNTASKANKKPKYNSSQMETVCIMNGGDWEPNKCYYTTLGSKTTQSEVQEVTGPGSIGAGADKGITTTQAANNISSACAKSKGKIVMTRGGEVEIGKGTQKTYQYVCTVPANTTATT